ncbi:MAG TPA: DUF3822 domain-containing protein [Flavobacteriaceae bacterium]|jgi:hypothetical protein|nr:DUF3822 domain-containing protein [Flavobacteriaceae bacterium]HBS12982.1 DUF3822 domain-containing protein [Flavobacteriaceae bacterium]
MIQPKKKLKANNLDVNHLKNNHLSIQFSLDGFSFCILNKEKSTFIALYDYQFKEVNNSPQRLIENITSIFENEELLQHKYKSVHVTHVNDLYTLVPKPLFDENKLQAYVSYNNKVYPQDYLVFDEIKNQDIISVFIPYVNINNFLIDKFSAFDFNHNSKILIESLLSVYKYSLTPQMFVHIDNNHFELIVITNKKLQLYNTFKFSTKEDFIYYVLFAAEQLKLNPEKFELVMLGNIQKDDELYSIAYTYIRNVSLLENRSKYKFDVSFTETDKRTYYTILNQY